MMDFVWNFFTNVENYIRFMFVTPWPTKEHLAGLVICICFELESWMQMHHAARNGGVVNPSQQNSSKEWNVSLLLLKVLCPF